MPLAVPSPGLVLLVGVSGSGKSTFAARHFAPTEVVSSDRCRAWVADDENDQTATADAFAVLHQLVGVRLGRGRLTVVDATSVQPGARAPLLALARRAGLPATAIVLDLPDGVLEARRAARSDRVIPPEAMARQREQLRRGLDALAHEGFAAVHVLRDAAAVAAATVQRVPLPPDRRDLTGPLDVIGDVHGCTDELCTLLARLGYVDEPDGGDAPAWEAEFAVRLPRWRHPAGRRVVFVGDLVDRGPRIVDALRLAMRMHADGRALAVVGNHDDKLLRHLRGAAVHVAHGLERTLAELDATSPTFRTAVRDFLGELPTHLLLDGGALVVAHAGLPESLHGREGRRGARSRALRRDHRHPGPRRAAATHRLGAALPRARARRLRAHAGARAALAGAHGRHRHGLRVRRRPHRAALARGGGGVGAGAPAVGGPGARDARGPVRRAGRGAGCGASVMHPVRPT
jgi:protein phosphatase